MYAPHARFCPNAHALTQCRVLLTDDDGGTRGECGAWLTGADGNGGSLERLGVDLDPSCGDTWGLSCNVGPVLFGTPGAAGC